MNVVLSATWLASSTLSLLVWCIDLFFLSIVDKVYLERPVRSRYSLVNENDLVVEHVFEVLVDSRLCHERNNAGSVLIQSRNEERTYLFRLGLV